MNIMLDTNVIIDYIAVRQPWYQDVEQIWKRIRCTIYTVDGTTLPENADALLILLPSNTGLTKRITDESDERQQAFTRFYTTVHQATQAIQLDELDDDQLNDLVHAARSA